MRPEGEKKTSLLVGREKGSRPDKKRVAAGVIREEKESRLHSGNKAGCQPLGETSSAETSAGKADGRKDGSPIRMRHRPTRTKKPLAAGKGSWRSKHNKRKELISVGERDLPLSAQAIRPRERKEKSAENPSSNSNLSIKGGNAGCSPPVEKKKTAPC